MPKFQITALEGRRRYIETLVASDKSAAFECWSAGHDCGVMLSIMEQSEIRRDHNLEHASIGYRMLM